MGQVLHPGAKTTHAVRAEIQRSQASIAALSKRYGINPKTVCKWKKRQSVEDAPMGPKNPRSKVLSLEEEAACVAFRKHTLLPLDDCLYALQPSIPHLRRSSLIAAESAMASHSCLTWIAISPSERSSSNTRLDTFTSTWHTSEHKKASSIFLWPLIEPVNSR